MLTLLLICDVNCLTYLVIRFFEIVILYYFLAVNICPYQGATCIYSKVLAFHHLAKKSTFWDPPMLRCAAADVGALTLY